MNIDPRKVSIAERDIEDYLFANPGIVKINNYEGVNRWIGRQARVPSGIIDLLGLIGSTLVVVEIKNVELLPQHITQVKRYAFDLDQIAIAAGRVVGHWGPYVDQCVPVLVGPSISDAVFRECEACGVSVCTFGVSMTLKVDPISWTDKYKTDRAGEYRYGSDFLNEYFKAVDGLAVDQRDEAAIIEDIPF